MVLAGLLGGTLLFYFTPLKNVNLLEPRIDNISPQDFYELYSKNPDHYIFIDVRSPEQFRQIHAPGSINIPLHTLYDQKNNLPKHEKELVLICSGGRASGVGYSYLEHYGFLNLKRVEGGIEAWHAVGLPVSIESQ